MGELLHRCMTKATTAEGNDIRHSLNWVLARRAFLKVFLDRLECGDWIIRYNEIDEAMLFRTRQMLIACYVLRIRSKHRIYQFGLNPGRFWAGELPFPLKRETGSLGYSWFSTVLRVLLFLMILYYVWRWLSG
jgi:hypothetical protein